jgi:hypothetical protein
VTHVGVVGEAFDELPGIELILILDVFHRHHGVTERLFIVQTTGYIDILVGRRRSFRGTDGGSRRGVPKGVFRGIVEKRKYGREKRVHFASHPGRFVRHHNLVFLIPMYGFRWMHRRQRVDGTVGR